MYNGQWTIPSLLYQTVRNNPLVYKGLLYSAGYGLILVSVLFCHCPGLGLIKWTIILHVLRCMLFCEYWFLNQSTIWQWSEKHDSLQEKIKVIFGTFSVILFENYWTDIPWCLICMMAQLVKCKDSRSRSKGCYMCRSRGGRQGFWTPPPPEKS